MCGIALIVSGIRIDVGDLVSDFVSPLPTPPQQESFSIYDIKIALRRRGPDSLGSRKVLICDRSLYSAGGEENIISLIQEVDDAGRDQDDDRPYIDSVLLPKGESHGTVKDLSYRVLGELFFIGAVLQLRGIHPVAQPFMGKSGNVLVYSGIINNLI